MCQVGFTNKGYRCVCRDGYKYETDECKGTIEGPVSCEQVPVIKLYQTIIANTELTSFQRHLMYFIKWFKKCTFK